MTMESRLETRIGGYRYCEDVHSTRDKENIPSKLGGINECLQLQTCQICK